MMILAEKRDFPTLWKNVRRLCGGRGHPLKLRGQIQKHPQHFKFRLYHREQLLRHHPKLLVNTCLAPAGLPVSLTVFLAKFDPDSRNPIPTATAYLELTPEQYTVSDISELSKKDSSHRTCSGKRVARA